MRILLQFPEGLKKYSLSYIEELEKRGHEVFLSARATYGGCDIALEEAKKIKASKIINFGHAPFPFFYRGKIKIEFVEVFIKIEDKKIEELAKNLKKNYKRIGLITTVQFVKNLKKIRQIFSSHGIRIFTKKGKKAFYSSQVLGCDVSASFFEKNKIDAILFIGDGKFHYLSIFPFTDIDILVYNPYTEKLERVNNELEQIRKRNKGMIIRALESNIFGILVSTKIGQFNLKLAKKIKKKLEQRGKKAIIIVGDDLNAFSISNYSFIDVFITLACPRLIEDSELFGKPILNLEMLNEFFKII